MFQVIRQVELSEVQKGIYFDCLVGDSIAYNISFLVSLERIDIVCLINSFKFLIMEQAVLRSSLEVIDENIKLNLYDCVDFVLEKIDQNEVNEKILLKFDLYRAPLWKAYLIDKGNSKYNLLIVSHHIISDGISLDIFKEKLFHFYGKLKKREKIHLKKDESYFNFIENENSKLFGRKYVKQEQYWREKAKSIEAVLLLGDYGKLSQQRGVGRELTFVIDEAVSEAMSKMAMSQEVTVFMLYLTAFSILIKHYMNSDNIVISSPFTHRPGYCYEETIGCFVHMLPMCFSFDKSDRFLDYLKKVVAEFISVYKHIGYPSNLILREIESIFCGNAASAIDVSFVYDVYNDSASNDMKLVVSDQGTITFPGNLMVILNKTPDGEFIKFQYKDNYFSEDSITLMGNRFIQLLKSLTADNNQKINSMELFLRGEKNELLSINNQSRYFSHHPSTIIDIFLEKVVDKAEKIAIIQAGAVETYQSLNDKSNNLAQQILNYGLGKNACIGVHLERSINMVVALLAILKAGYAYVAVEPTYPLTRKAYILKDASIKLLISNSYFQDEFANEIDTLNIDSLCTVQSFSKNINQSEPKSIAYIAYTSGSTGKPKGVMIEHHSVVNVLKDLERRFPVREKDVYLFKTPYTFDISVTELFGWFIGEGALYILEPYAEKDPQKILEVIYNNGISHINFIPSMFQLFIDLFNIDSNLEKIQTLKWIFLGGEKVTLEIVSQFIKLKTDVSLENVYGPTECTLWSTHQHIESIIKSNRISIGKPLNEMRCYVLGNQNRLQPVGIPGELCISGVGLARGYLNLVQKTEEKFVQNPFFREEIDAEYFRRMYRTGDLVRWLPNGELDFIGRIDSQVKFRGIRLELEEIESVLLENKKIRQAAVVLKTQENGFQHLCAYYLAKAKISEFELKQFLSERLPPYMIPSYYIHKNEFPINNAGKLNRKLLSADIQYLRSKVSNQEHPRSELEINIGKVWTDVLNAKTIGLDDSFFELGGHSLSLIQLHNKLKRQLNIEISIPTLFQLPSIRLQAQYILDNQEKFLSDRHSFFQRDKTIVHSDLAIIGVSVRVPGADTHQEFWENLKNKKESIYFYSDDELENLGIDKKTLKAPNFVKAKGRVNGVDYFDTKFFDYTPADINIMSPQLRLLYKGAWEAFEDAGYAPDSMNFNIGVFIGGSDDFEWYDKALLGLSSYSDKYQAFTLGTNHFLATRLAYKLNIRGPVFSALTGCSTTLVTTHLACQSLKLRECDIALAGGITIELPNEGGYFYQDGMMFSPDGHCRPFDDKAEGTMFSNGMGLVVLKRLVDAIRDKDNIYAVIKGSAINNDGNQKHAFSAPSSHGQADVIQQAYKASNIDPESIGYIEAHGTGTDLGDPIEVESLTTAFSTEKKQYCALGSVKGNIGHTDTAAGVVGLIKVALSLRNKYIPATANYEKPNRNIEFKKTPFFVNKDGIEWESKNVLRRAGINSFGVGGTNAHMVLEEFQGADLQRDQQKIGLLIFSAKDGKALDGTSKKVLNYIVSNPNLNLADVAWTLQVGRKHFRYRKYLTLNLSRYDDVLNYGSLIEKCPVFDSNSSSRKVYFMFSGQGSQYQGMACDLYHDDKYNPISKLFKRYIDEVFSLMPFEDRAIFNEVIFGKEDPDRINQTEYSQPALFIIGYALAQCLIELGIKPDGMLGHSIGELVAATVSGMFKLSDAIKIVRLRGQLMQNQPSGGMLAVIADSNLVKANLIEGTWLALDNTTNRCVIAGNPEAIVEMETIANRENWKAIRLKTSHAFHTPMMKGAAEEFKKNIVAYKFGELQIPIISNVTGEWFLENECGSPEYWSKHMLSPVKFNDSLSCALQNKEAVFLEIGPGNTLSSFLRQHRDKCESHKVINFIKHPKEKLNDVVFIYNKIGECWAAGLQIDWNILNGDVPSYRVSLPTYVFSEDHYPIANSGQSIASDRELGDFSLEKKRNPNGSSNEKIALKAYQVVFGIDNISEQDDFFSLGGDSLKAVSLVSILKELTGIDVAVKDVFSCTTPIELAHFLSESINMGARHSTLMPATNADYYPASSAQCRMYMLHVLNKNNIAYNLSSATLIEGNLDKGKFKNALIKLIDRHESLRTSFLMQDDKLMQVIHDEVKLPYKYQGVCTADKDTLISNFIRPFDLEEAPLFRAELIKVEENKHLLLFDVHHIVADGSSVEIITKDFNQLYFDVLDPLALQYKDFCAWQKENIYSNEIDEQKNYWLSQLSGDLPLLILPTDYKRPSVKKFQGGRVYFRLPENLTDSLMEIIKNLEVTPFMFFLAAWNILLARYSGQEDIIVGVPVSGRTVSGTEKMVGMFVNILAMRNHPNKNIKFSDFLEEIKRNALLSFKHQDYQFDDLIEQLNLERQLDRNVLFDVCFDYQNMEFHDFELDNLLFEPYQFDTRTAIYDLVLTCQENRKDNSIGGFIEYSSFLFKKETIERMTDNYLNLLSSILNDTDQEIQYIDIISKQESNQISLFNQTQLEYDDSKSIQSLFEEKAKLLPDKIAVISANGHRLTYKDFNKYANIIASLLMQAGVKKGSVVGIMLSRDEWLLISQFAIIKSGAAYLLIDVELPQKRIDYMLEESQPNTLITNSMLGGTINFDGQVINVDNVDIKQGSQSKIKFKPLPEDLATIIYTSGSTGKPKGVMINYGSMLNFVRDIEDRGLFKNNSDRVIAITTVSFDIFGFESLVPLCLGYSIYLANEQEQLDPALASRKIVEYQVTHIVGAVSRIKAFIDNSYFSDALNQLQCIICGGENLSKSLLKDLQSQSQASIFNMYGPSETTIWSCTKDLTKSNAVNIGKPIANTKIQIVNEAGKLQPIGVFGEICISGKGVARCYINNADATKKSFVMLNTNPSDRYYKTGDCGRYLLNGDIELKGRLDSQIKIRGCRIELSEIEKSACSNEEVKHAVSQVYQDNNGNKKIVLYYSLKNSEKYQTEDFKCLQSWLSEKLPHFMMPSEFKRLKSFPYLPNGKIDRKSLPPIIEKHHENLVNMKEISSSLEEKLLNIWREVLDTNEFSIYDNFFDIGGNSLSLMQVNNKFSEIFNKPIPLIKLFENPTVASLARHLEKDEKEYFLLGDVQKPFLGNSENSDVAVIGMSGCFPGAENIDAFWENLLNGVESIAEFNDKELIASGVNRSELSNQHYIKRKGFLENAEYFDSDFFQYSHGEATAMDPQIRLLHQCAWNVLENSGYNSSHTDETVGLFAGSSSNALWIKQFFDKESNLLDAFEAITLNEKDFLTTRLSYKLNLKGPSYNVQTACSTSLVAIHQAAQAIQNGECSMAIAGGVSISYPRKEGYLWHEGMIFSEDGYCKPFSKDATGTVPGNGCGLVMLKSLDKAVLDGDHIYAIIKGSATNNDGIEKIGYTAPSIEGQSNVIQMALGRAKVLPEDIFYLESHGTGTALGDPIEIEALKKAWHTNKQNYCALGSVKANIGHCDAAAGVASFIKAVLSIYYRIIPPQINFTEGSDKIDFDNSPFYINPKSIKITDRNKTLLAGVSSFGIGGTNVHTVLQQAPELDKKLPQDVINILVFSAKTLTALENTSQKIYDFLEKNQDTNLSDAAWTLQVGRKHLRYRKAWVIDKNSKSIFPKKVYDTHNRRKNILFRFDVKNGDYISILNNLYFSRLDSQPVRLIKSSLDCLISQLNSKMKDRLVSVIKNKEQDELALFALEYSIGLTLIKKFKIKACAIYCENENLATGVLFGKYKLKEVLSVLDDKRSIDTISANFETVPWLSKKSFEDLCQKENYICLEINCEKASNKINYTIADLWLNGIDINWSCLFDDNSRRKIPLPGYVFDKTFFKADISMSAQSQAIDTSLSASRNLKTQILQVWKGIFGTNAIDEESDFFSMGGDSLKAVMLAAEIKSKLSLDFSPSDVFDRPQFSQMLELLTQKELKYQAHITAIDKSDSYPASSAQKRLYSVQKILEESIAYNLASAHVVYGAVSKERFKRAITKLVMRHESLRTRFKLLNDELVQVIDDKVELPVEFARGEERSLVNEFRKFVKPFDLHQSPLFRIKLISFSEKKYLLLIDMHHIIADQFSISILLKELRDLYDNKNLPELRIQYKDFSAWQNNFFLSENYKQQIEFWKHELGSEIPTLDFPTDFKRPEVKTFNGKNISFEVDKVLCGKIYEVARTRNCTPYMIFLSAFNLLLSRYTNQKDIIIGTGILGRNHSDCQSIVGMFANTLAIRMMVEADLTIDQYFTAIKEKLLKIYGNQACQFERLIELVQPNIDLSRNPIFDIVFNYIDMGKQDLSLQGLKITPFEAEKNSAKFDFTLTLEKQADQFHADIEYSTDLFKEDTIRTFFERMMRVLEYMLGANGDAQLKDIKMLTSEEEDWLIYQLNNTETNYPQDKTIVDLFAEQVKQHGEQPALFWQNQEYSYNKAYHFINLLACKLTGYNPGVGDRIAILLKRGPLQIIAIMAILKLGCAYVPIDPDYPDARINYIIEDSNAMLLIIDRAITSQNRIETLKLNFESDFIQNQTDKKAKIKAKIKSNNLAYIIYTSGSTGKPKGNLITHRNIIRTVVQTNYVNFLPDDRILQLSNYAFDGSVFDIFGALLNGSCLVMIPKSLVVEISDLTEFIKTEKITLFYSMAALLNAIVDWDVMALKHVRKIYCGGEAMSVTHARKIFKALGPNRLINAYGPTESTVFAAYHPVSEIGDIVQNIPIGLPISNTKLYVLDDQLSPVPPGIKGELCIGGDGLGKGYVNNNQLTKDKFIDNPFIYDEKIYCTGDQVVRLVSGEIIYIGRLDFQVKVRGFRVELDEIKYAITSLPGIADAVVIAKNKDHVNTLHAYYTVEFRYKKLLSKEIKQALVKVLPEYMIPSEFIELDKIPLTTNDKIDLKSLSSSVYTKLVDSERFENSSDVKKILLNEMKIVLGNESITCDDSFFASGGNSIKAISYAYNLSRRGIDIRVNEIFQYPSVKLLMTISSIQKLDKDNPKDQLSLGNKSEPILLNDAQVHHYKSYVDTFLKNLSALITSTAIKNTFPLSGAQQLHLNKINRQSGFMMNVGGVYTQLELQSIVATVIGESQILHSAINEPTHCWEEYQISSITFLIKQNIPYLDLTMFDTETRSKLSEAINAAVIGDQYRLGALPWRVIIYKNGNDLHKIIFGFDHIAFDGMSSELIKHQIENILFRKVSFEDKQATPSYQDYVILLQHLNRNIDEEILLDKFNLSQWCRYIDRFFKSVRHQSGRNVTETTAKIELININQDDILEFSFDLVCKVLCYYTGITKLPIALVSYGREYNDKKFYNTVGEFLDIIPILQEKSARFISQQIELCKKIGANFLNIIFSGGYQNRHKKIISLLEPYFNLQKEKANLLLINFQGYIKLDEKNEFLSALKNVSNDEVADFQVTINYDDEYLCIEFHSCDGLNKEKLDDLINHSLALEEVENV